MEKRKILRGQCHCGAVSYEVSDGFEYALNCHCSDCRKTTGSAFKPLAGIKVGEFRVVQGEEQQSAFGDESCRDVFCAKCSSLLYSVVRDNAYIHIALGTLIDVPSMKPTCHIFVGDKAPWYEIRDELPQFDEYPT